MLIEDFFFKGKISYREWGLLNIIDSLPQPLDEELLTDRFITDKVAALATNGRVVSTINEILHIEIRHYPCYVVIENSPFVGRYNLCLGHHHTIEKQYGQLLSFKPNHAWIPSLTECAHQDALKVSVVLNSDSLNTAKRRFYYLDEERRRNACYNNCS